MITACGPGWASAFDGRGAERRDFRSPCPLDFAPLIASIRSVFMGKGDSRTRRGKIYQGSFGKSRPKDPAKKKKRIAAKK
jgi:30S ribosomal protein S31